jgi:hypothetical protein
MAERFWKSGHGFGLRIARQAETEDSEDCKCLQAGVQ